MYIITGNFVATYHRILSTSDLASGGSQRTIAVTITATATATAAATASVAVSVAQGLRVTGLCATTTITAAEVHPLR